MDKLKTKARQTYQQLLKYAAFASVGLIFDYSTLIFLKQVIGLYYLLAVCGGFVVGLIITYVLTNRYVFGKPKGNHSLIFIAFGVIGIGGLIILNILVWLLTDGLNFNYILSKSIATVFVFMWNFFARRSLFQDNPLSSNGT